MLLYFGTLFFAVFVIKLAEVARQSRFVSRLLLVVAALPMILLAGLRNRTVGTDTSTYVEHFNRIHIFTDIKKSYRRE